MYYQHVVLEGLACCTPSGSFMSGTHRLIKKPAKTGWVYIVILRAGCSTCGLLSPSSPHQRFVYLSLSAGRARIKLISLNLWYSYDYGNILWHRCLSEHKTSRIFYLQLHPNTQVSLIHLETTYPKHSRAWGPQISNAWLRLRAAPWECRAALSLHLPSQKQIVRGQSLIYVWGWSPGMWE